MRDRQSCVYGPASGFDGTLSIGVTSNLVGRIVQHRAGNLAEFGSRHGAVILAWFETTETMADAIAGEKRIEGRRRERKTYPIERDDPGRGDLAVGLGLPPPDRRVGGRPRIGGFRSKPGVTGGGEGRRDLTFRCAGWSGTAGVTG